MLARIVDHEATMGDPAEARKWVDRGITEKVSPAYQTAVARELAATAQREAADRQAAQQAAKDQKAQQPADEPSGRDTVRANKELSRDLLSGRTQQQVLDALGKPDEAQDVEGFAEMWYYHNAGVDPVTGRKAAIVQVVFDGGVVSLVNFN